jgi:hypothetical protein
MVIAAPVSGGQASSPPSSAADLRAAATGAFLELQAALNTIWRVKPNPSLNIRA